jgi:hypothetical protein
VDYDRAPQGLLVFVHGGYWLRFDREMWSHLAAGAVARGWACAIPSYTLAPEARISAMTQEIASVLATSDGSLRSWIRPKEGPLRGGMPPRVRTYAPGLRAKIVAREVWSPLDLDREPLPGDAVDRGR